MALQHQRQGFAGVISQVKSLVQEASHGWLQDPANRELPGRQVCRLLLPPRGAYDTVSALPQGSRPWEQIELQNGSRCTLAVGECDVRKARAGWGAYPRAIRELTKFNINPTVTYELFHHIFATIAFLLRQTSEGWEVLVGIRGETANYHKGMIHVPGGLRVPSDKNMADAFVNRVREKTGCEVRPIDWVDGAVQWAKWTTEYCPSTSFGARAMVERPDGSTLFTHGDNLWVWVPEEAFLAATAPQGSDMNPIVDAMRARGVRIPADEQVTIARDAYNLGRQLLHGDPF